ncbi:MAG: hypothetical protein IJS14_02295 [Lentisphaeria bacterium]|nr:hypothetical protein [Lentisphaeria bacterium]
MLTYTVTSGSLAEADIYEITPVSSLTEFLEPHSSLCIVKTPFEGSIAEMMRIMGKDWLGKPMRVYLGLCSENDQGRLKCKLDQTLRSPFLFISWKAKGHHVFKMVKERRTLAEFPDFHSALDTYFPDGFLPEKCYRRQHTVFGLMFLSMRRRSLFRELGTVLRRYMKKRNGQMMP